MRSVEARKAFLMCQHAIEGVGRPGTLGPSLCADQRVGKLDSAFPQEVDRPMESVQILENKNLSEGELLQDYQQV